MQGKGCVNFIFWSKFTLCDSVVHMLAGIATLDRSVWPLLDACVPSLERIKQQATSDGTDACEPGTSAAELDGGSPPDVGEEQPHNEVWTDSAMASLAQALTISIKTRAACWSGLGGGGGSDGESPGQDAGSQPDGGGKGMWQPSDAGEGSHEPAHGLGPTLSLNLGNAGGGGAEERGEPNEDEPCVLGKQTDGAKRLQAVMRDIQDPLLPVRAHALLQLRDLTQSTRAMIRDNLGHILTRLSECLGDSDSYLYLAAIEALATLGIAFPPRVVPRMVSEFRNEQLPLELRLKTGEAMMQVVRGLGPALPKHAHRFMPSMLDVGAFEGKKRERKKERKRKKKRERER